MAETQKPKTAPKKKAAPKKTTVSAETNTIEVESLVKTNAKEGKTIEEIDSMVNAIFDAKEGAENKAEEEKAEIKALDERIEATKELMKEVHDSTEALEDQLANATPTEAERLINKQIQHIDDTVNIKKKMINPNITWSWNGATIY